MAIPDEARQVIELAKEWRSAASDGLWQPRGGIARFLTLWMATNAIYEMLFPDLKGDKAKLRAFARWAPVQAAHAANMGKDTYRRAMQSLAEPGVWNYDKKEWLRLSADGGSEETLLVVYQIRCNLFHGRKSPSNMRDARLVGASSRIVSRILDSLFSSPDDIWVEGPP